MGFLGITTSWFLSSHRANLWTKNENTTHLKKHDPRFSRAIRQNRQYYLFTCSLALRFVFPPDLDSTCAIFTDLLLICRSFSSIFVADASKWDGCLISGFILTGNRKPPCVCLFLRECMHSENTRLPQTVFHDHSDFLNETPCS